jgi:hypothetical protein
VPGDIGPRAARHPPTKHGLEDNWHGTGWGAYFGFLFGALFRGPRLRVTVSAAAGAVSRSTNASASRRGSWTGSLEELTDGREVERACCVSMPTAASGIRRRPKDRSVSGLQSIV